MVWLTWRIGNYLSIGAWSPNPAFRERSNSGGVVRTARVADGEQGSSTSAPSGGGDEGQIAPAGDDR